MSEVVDLLAALRENTRRGAGREVDLYHPAPSTRGIAEGSDSSGQTQAAPMDGGRGAAIARESKIRARLFDGSFTAEDVEWIRPRLRTSNLLTRGGLEQLSCEGCTFHRPVMYGQAEIAASPCELDSVCWRNERAVAAEGPLPLWRLRTSTGKPNYASASEQDRFLREAGWLAWSAGARKGPDAGVAATSGGRTKKVEWPTPWETWVEEQEDARRVPPATCDRRLLAEWQVDLLDGEALPIERLTGERAHPWRRWDGPDEPPKRKQQVEDEDTGELDIEPLEAVDIEEVAAA